MSTQQTSGTVLALLGSVIVFLLAGIAFIAFRHEQVSLFTLAFAATMLALLLGTLLPQRRR